MNKLKYKNFFRKCLYFSFGIDKLFLLIIILNIIGSIYFYEKVHSTIYIPIIYGAVGYLIGYLLSKKSIFSKIKLKVKSINSSKWNETIYEFIALWLLFILFFIFGFSLFIDRGIPLFNTFNNELRSTFGDGAGGRIRFLCTGLPMITTYMFLLKQKTGHYKKSFAIMLLITITGLAFYSYKAYILWFIIVLFYTYYYTNKNLGKDLKIFKWIVLGIFVIAGLIYLFSIWLGNNADASTSFLNRILYDEIDGFNYVYQKYVPKYGFMNGKYIESEIRNIMLKANTNGYTFMETLAKLFYGRKVTWGIVITIYGCFYIDYGNIGVLVGLLLFGFIICTISKYLNHYADKKNINIVCYLMFIALMGYIFQNGSIVNEIRGTLLSIIFIKVVFEILLYTIRSIYKKDL